MRFIYNELLIHSPKVNVNVEVFEMVLIYTICNVILSDVSEMSIRLMYF